MEEKNKIPFPQANDFGKILLILNINDENDLLNKNFLQEYLSLGTPRQISYYLSACEFIGFIDHKHNFTDFGIMLRESSMEYRMLRVMQKVVFLPVFGEVFFMKYLFQESVLIEDIMQIIMDVYGIENEEVCKRRASTVKKWIEWIESNKGLK